MWKTWRLTSHRCGLRFADWMLQDAAEMYCRQWKSAGQCPLVPPHATTKATTNQSQTYRRLQEFENVKRWDNVKYSFIFIPIHSGLANAKAKQHHTTPRLSQTQTSSSQCDHMRHCALHCASQDGLQCSSCNETIRARWLEMARVIRSACGFIVLYSILRWYIHIYIYIYVIYVYLDIHIWLHMHTYHIDLSLSISFAEVVLYFASSWKVVQCSVWSGLVCAWLQGPCPYIYNRIVCACVCVWNEYVKGSTNQENCARDCSWYHCGSWLCNKVEIHNRLAMTTRTCFWNKVNTSTTWKMQVFNAIIRTKLMHGIETIQSIYLK